MTQISSLRTKFFWDFFGPHAEPTAIHFEKHLHEFLNREGLSNTEVGRDSHQHSLHCSVWCIVAHDKKQGVEAALRPKRKQDLQ